MRAREVSALKRENRHLVRAKDKQGEGTAITSAAATTSVAKTQRLARRVEMLEDDLRKMREERSRFQRRQQQLGAELNAKVRKLGEERMRLSEHNVLLRADAEAREAEIKICRTELRKFATEAHGLRAQLRLAEGDGVGGDRSISSGHGGVWGGVCVCGGVSMDRKLTHVPSCKHPSRKQAAMLKQLGVRVGRLQRELGMWEQQYEDRVKGAVASAMAANTLLLRSQRERMMEMEQKLARVSRRDSEGSDGDGDGDRSGSGDGDGDVGGRVRVRGRGNGMGRGEDEQDRQHQQQKQQPLYHTRARSGLSRALLEPGQDGALSAAAGAMPGAHAVVSASRAGEMDDGESAPTTTTAGAAIAPATAMATATATVTARAATKKTLPVSVAAATAVAVAAAEARAASRIADVVKRNAELEKRALRDRRAIEELAAQLAAARRREASLMARLRRP